jgi:hypothetical protein
MKLARAVVLSLSMMLLCSLFSLAQQSSASAANATVPPLIPFSSVATDDVGNSLSGVVNITFSLYARQQGGAPLGQTPTTRAETLPLAVPPTPKETPQLHTPRVAPVRPATGPKPLVRAELQPLAAQPR